MISFWRGHDDVAVLARFWTISSFELVMVGFVVDWVDWLDASVSWLDVFVSWLDAMSLLA